MNSRKEENVDFDNKELQNALQIMQFTRRSLFLTGKAGTGKSTFLRYICQNTKKKHVVLAPTGIAAINVCGSTLHSFFKIPFHPLLPNDSRYTPRKIRETLKYSSEKIKLIRELELIIIDEISMVRADIIDFIDKVLRVYSRNMREPFGGKQLLFVGDVYQLEPVVKEDDRQLLSPYYPSPYFFNARVFREMKLVSIELQKVYRQTDAHFINILDHIRIGQPSQHDIDAINKQVKSVNYSKSDNDKSIVITLSTRRDTVDYINQKRLEQLDGDIVTFNGVVKGDFPENSLPTPLQLELKAGAQVIFVKNDSDHRWVNGTLATITCIDCNSQDEEAGDIITVVTENGEEYQVERERWSNMRYRYNEEEKRIEEEEIGT
ncbi:MAG: AAA family ATPase, partial [Prevotella sp.]|nr:AAA family ATPase [Prevotella sp.]